MFEKVAIIGPGLIGGSMGMAMRQRDLAASVVGIGRRRQSLERALQVGAVDEVTLDVAEGVSGADLVVLATPASAFGSLLERAAPALKPNAVLTDVASTKVDVVECVSTALRERPDVAFVPAHPIAGSERRGPLAADAELFEGAVCILTPMTNTFPDSKKAVARLWQALGARTVSMTPQAHDRLVARISHLPHLTAVALMALVAPDEAELSGGGLRDSTRVASGDPDLWREICRANRGAIREALVDLIAVLKEMADALQRGDMDALHRMLEEAKQKRDTTIASHEGEGQ